MVSPIGTKASEEQCYMGTYHSTRGRTLSCSSKVAIRTGIAPDGGLFVSDELGTQQVDISSLADKSYFEIAQDVLGMLLNDYTAEEISACVDEAYRGTFASEEVTPLVKLDAAPGADAPQTYVMELFGGPTSAFKDVALQMLPRLMARTSAKDGGAERIMIVTATSGDTGKAALAGFADAPGTGITVFYPEGKVSRVQNLQMSTQEGDNVAVCGIRGNFDDAQTGVKKVFGDKAIAAELEKRNIRLSSANSINWGRLVPQIVYYFAAYAQLLNAGKITFGDEVDFCVPTGNFGDILAGYYAKQMGLPVGKLVCASNENNVLTDFLTTGTYTAKREFFKTTSPSMDILVSSNLERLLYHVTGSDAEVAGLMKSLAETGSYTVRPETLAAIQENFSCGWSSEEEVAGEIRVRYEKDNYLCDTHTAVAFHVAAQKKREGVPMVVLSTASPFKFPRSVLSALGKAAPENDSEAMQQLEAATGHAAPASLAALRSKPERFDTVIAPAQIAEVALGYQA